MLVVSFKEALQFTSHPLPEVRTKIYFVLIEGQFYIVRRTIKTRVNSDVISIKTGLGNDDIVKVVTEDKKQRKLVSLEDSARSGWHNSPNIVLLQTLVYENPKQTTQGFRKQFKHLHKLGEISNVC